MSSESGVEFNQIECQEFCAKVADGTHESPLQTEFGKRLATSKNIKDGRLNLDNAYLISQEDFDDINRRSKVDQWDILISMIGTVGEVCLVDSHSPDFAIKNVGLLKCRDKIHAKWLYYFFRSSTGRQLVEERKKGTTQQYISLGEIRRLPISVPSEAAFMKTVTDILSALDDRIALLRETNATLEAIAQALFKSWFVDFDPVHAKLEGRAPEGMDEATATLFPGSFEKSELGLVPRGWKVGTLANLATLNPESWSAKNHPDTLAYIDLANAKDNEIAEVSDYLFDEAPSRARRVLRDGDTIVGTVRPGNRSFAFIHEPSENLTASTGFAVLRPTQIANTEFVYLAATQDASIEHLSHLADGAAYPAVRPDVVAGIQCVLPSADIMKIFHDVTAPLLSKVSDNKQQAQTLATLRDTLLPRLMSGKISLSKNQSSFASPKEFTEVL